MTRTIVYYTDSTAFGGVEKIILQHLAGLDLHIWQPVLIYHPGNGIAPLLSAATQLGVRLIETPPLPLGLAGAHQLPAFKAILHSLRPSIFHAHLSWPLACKWGLAAALFERVPVVVATLHLWVDASYTLSSRLQEALIARRLDKYIAVSQGIAGKLQSTFGVPSSKLQVIHPSVDYHQFENAASLPLPIELASLSNRPVVLTVARLDEQKNISTLLEAATQVPGTLFVLVGDGPERGALEIQSQQLGLQDRVIFTGFRQDIPAWLGHSDLFVLPSLYEGLPIALLEAMAAGKPVIASEIPGIMEAVRHAETGWLVPPGDPAALAGAIRLLLKDKTLAPQLAAAGQARVRQDFSVQHMNRQVQQVYASLLNGTREGEVIYA